MHAVLEGDWLQEDITAQINTVEEKHESGIEAYEDLKREQVDEIRQFDGYAFPDGVPENSVCCCRHS